MEQLAQRGIDCDALARLSRDNPKECKEQLKSLGIKPMGAMLRVFAELIAYQLPAAPPPLTPAPPEALPAISNGEPSHNIGRETFRKVGSETEKKLLIRGKKLKEEGNVSFKDQNYVAACAAYREGIEAIAAVRLSAPTMEAQAAPLLVSLHSNMCIALMALQQFRAARDSAGTWETDV